MSASLVGSEMCIRDRDSVRRLHGFFGTPPDVYGTLGAGSAPLAYSEACLWVLPVLALVRLRRACLLPSGVCGSSARAIQASNAWINL
eukprot:15104413-Alexandrium_andersonii.AAC.1